MKRKIITINKLLLDHFEIPIRSKKLPDPMDLLIATILSQNTNDKNSYKAFKNLKEKYKKWEDVARLTKSSIEKLIKVAGLGKQKSAAIKNLLSGLLKSNGNINLNHIKRLSDEEILDELTSYKGIGIKTASCVLLFSLDRNVCPVDTHVHRSLNRIGLVKTSSPEKTFYSLNGNLPPKAAHQFHTNLIRLGREICKAQKPGCSICPLQKKCTFPDKNLEKVSGSKENSFMLLDSIN
ncbi:MAG: endonuclease III [Ignavibacteriae bacterium]|nr:MAG: endonuclease III [Ignavibacteriota bacterium]